MKNYQIVTDATSDLPLELVGKLDVHVIPMHCVIDGTDYLITADNRNLSSHDFYDMLRAGKVSSTTQVNGESFKDEVRPFLKQGLDILYICFSSGLSSTYTSICIAIEDLKEEFPDRKLLIVDSLSATGGEGLLTYYAAKRAEEGMSIEDLAQWIEDNKLHLAHWFTVDDLKFLKRGGRVSATAALVGTVLSVKPIMHVDNEGKLIPVDKVRGRKKSLEELVAHMEKSAIEPADQTVFISHGDTPEDAAYIEKLVREKLGVKNVFIGPVGPVVGSHGGPGIICLFFLATER
ncbi:MAG: DegV family protein [Oscillospiraceae bacterium]|jgi:DegV family protein with EDD domain